MPYNTRRKSLSLPSLGIHLPHSSRSQQAPPASAKAEHSPHKRTKRDYSPTITVAHKHGRYDPTPPPSPPPESKINHADINDEIVSGVAKVLEQTGNRPHTVKELAISLAPIVNLVENSANPTAIISSRLNAYLKRGFTPSSPCLLKKELITTHPRRIYFYLTMCPHQPIPQHENDLPSSRRSVVSPALSDEEEEEMRRRSELSPSPEVDLSSHELDDGDSTDTGSLASTSASMISGQRNQASSSLSHKNHLASPPLEGDEREFSQSAIFIERRSTSRDNDSSRHASKRTREEFESEVVAQDERTYEEATATLLGYPTSNSEGAFNSPALAPTNEDSSKREDVEKTPSKIPHHPHHHMMSSFSEKVDLYSWSGELERHLGSPESVELDELDDMLDF
ncbi:hypothetical protein BZA05DRAFT_330391 [Tricharina praecox]|uniref:uncharacterized protein n=1 Tax=Tricharina praecox TaxID=43433 RepID=UPI002220FCFB|nr:uncharacterized protein BZA05DRAFT_330391 [Tricharina praecox]KAI5858503.1 hypothetical protein BZA05DRAFT_330391 [Tricharina praecox]